MCFKFCLLLLWLCLPSQSWFESQANLFGDDVIDFRYSSKQKYIAVAKPKYVEIYDGVYVKLLVIYKIKDKCQFFSFSFSEQETQLVYTCINFQRIATVSRILLGSSNEPVDQPRNPLQSFTFENSPTEVITECYSLNGQYFIISLDGGRLSLVSHNYVGEIKDRDSNMSFSVLENIPRTNYFVGFDDKIRLFSINVIETMITSQQSKFTYEYVNQLQFQFNETFNTLAVSSVGEIFLAGKGNVIKKLRWVWWGWDRSEQILIQNMKGNEIKRMMISQSEQYKWLTVSTDKGYIYILDISYYYNDTQINQPVEIFSFSSKFSMNFGRDHLIRFSSLNSVRLFTQCNHTQYLTLRFQCSSCAYPCVTCLVNSDSCLTCYQGHYLDPNLSKCFLCPYSCDKCSDSETCQQCSPYYDARLQGTQCVLNSKRNKLLLILTIVLSIVLFVSLMILTCTIVKLRNKKLDDKVKGEQKNSTSVSMKPRAQSHENL